MANHTACIDDKVGVESVGALFANARSSAYARYALPSTHRSVRRRDATNSGWADCLDLATTPEGFSQAVHQRLQTGLPVEQRRARLRLETEGWAVKASAFAHWIGASA